MNPQVHAFFDDITFTYSYVVVDPGSGKCALVESVLNYDQSSGRTSLTAANR